MSKLRNLGVAPGLFAYLHSTKAGRLKEGKTSARHTTGQDRGNRRV